MSRPDDTPAPGGSPDPITETPGVGRVDLWAKVMPASWVPAVMLGLAALCYGVVPSMNKVVGEAGVNPLVYAFWFSFLGATVAGAICLFSRRRPRFSAAHIKAYIATGFFGIPLPFIFLTLAAPHLPASVVALLLALVPASTYVMALIFRMDRFRWLSVLGLTTGLGGVLFLVIPEGALPEGDALVWIAVALVAPLSFAMSNVLAVIFRPPDSPSITLAFGLLLASAVAMLPAALFFGSGYAPLPPVTDVDFAVLTVGGVMALFIFFFFEVIHRAGPVFFSQFNYFTLITGIAWASVIFNEVPNFWFVLALIAMLAGLVMVNAGTRASRKAAGSAEDAAES